MLLLFAGYKRACKAYSQCGIASQLKKIPHLWKPSAFDIFNNGHVKVYHATPNKCPKKSTFCGKFLDPNLTAHVTGKIIDRANAQGKVQQGYEHWVSSRPPKDVSSWLLVSEPLVYINEQGEKELEYVGYFDHAKPGAPERRYYQSRLAIALTELGTFSVFPFGKGRTDPSDGMYYDECEFPHCKTPPGFPFDTQVNDNLGTIPTPPNPQWWLPSTRGMGRGRFGNIQGRGGAPSTHGQGPQGPRGRYMGRGRFGNI